MSKNAFRSQSTTWQFGRRWLPSLCNCSTASRALRSSVVPAHPASSASHGVLALARHSLGDGGYIGSWLSHSLPSDAWSPSRPWLLLVLSFIVFRTGDLNPIWTAPMLGAHNCLHTIWPIGLLCEPKAFRRTHSWITPTSRKISCLTRYISRASSSRTSPPLCRQSLTKSSNSSTSRSPRITPRKKAICKSCSLSR